MSALARYRTAIWYPRVARVLAAVFVCRLLAGMVSLALLLAAEEATGSYASAGAVTGAFAVALAFTSPMWGRAVDRRGSRGALALASLLQFTGFVLFVVLAAAGVASLLLVGIAFLTGACTPPASAISNTVFIRYVPDEEIRRTLFAVGGLLTQSVFILGPLIVAGVVAVRGPLDAVVLCAVTSLVGVWWLRGAAAVRLLDQDRPSLAVRFGLVASRRQAHVLIVVAVAAFAIGALQVSVVAQANERGATAGVWLAIMACGGACGTFLYGGIKLPGSLLVQLTVALAIYGCCSLAVGFDPGVLLICSLLFVIGAVDGPADAIEALLIGDYSPKHAQAQAFALLIAANWVGFAVGSAVGGALVQYVSAGFGAICGAVAAIVAAMSLLLPVLVETRSRRGDVAEHVEQ